MAIIPGARGKRVVGGEVRGDVGVHSQAFGRTWAEIQK